ncbi:hypothetical protein GCM10010387_52190 [Streptomyces inusitatus]|uniref:DUF7847 domain-containing protein n=1 Tax=Streptomyces inusitatus TaxID=68221 RepID=A0A918V041_9ACTN|nr:hypothetical protein [Streptomyces inusitatus]GGZ51576.1 hypothetical protein GCM10010387_52190 [Streptomyces inusitatus]
MGEIFEGAVSTLRRHWRTMLTITVTISVIAQLANTLTNLYLTPDPVRVDAKPGSAEALRQSVEYLQASLLGLVPTMIITMVVTLFTTALLTIVMSRSVLGRPVTLAEAWREARPRLPQLLGLIALMPAIALAVTVVGLLPGMLVGGTVGRTLIAFGTIAAIAVVIWLYIRFVLASPALMLERQGVIASLRRSSKLVQNAWWRIFGIILLTLVITLLVTLVVAVPFTVIGFIADGSGIGDLMAGRNPDFGWQFLTITGIGGVIAAAITSPVSAGVTVLLYIDQRIRREALDLELARAAGLPGYGTEPPSGAPAN